jgi:hypothetical protein
MNDFLNDLKADLVDRRMLPLVAVVLVALVAAIGFVALGGSSSSSPEATAGAVTPALPNSKGISVTPTFAGANQSIAETTDGLSTQRHGHARDPFSTLAGIGTAATAASKASSVASEPATKSSSPSKSESPSSSGSTPSGSSKPSKPAAPAKPKMLFSVAFEFGALPATGATVTSELQSFPSVTKATALPSAKERVIEFIGVTVAKAGDTASFAVDAEVILKGAGTCEPSVAQCQLFNLKEGQSEQLEYFTSSGALVTYELRLVSIATNAATSAALHKVARASHAAPHGLLGPDGTLRGGLRLSTPAGELVLAPRGAFGGGGHPHSH